MKTFLVPSAAVLMVGLVQLVSAEPPAKGPGKELVALERIMLGAWQGQEGCSGRYLFNADGTYELKGFGPGGDETAGTWKVRWDALPPTLVLTCKASESDEDIGKETKVKLLQLDDASLTIEYDSKTVYHYARPKK
ncbi:MAG: hypothetical protein ACKVP0_28305 [Pirellulaceae bacterium]